MTKTYRLCGHEAGALCGIAQKVVAANVALLFEKGGKERVDHPCLSWFTSNEPCLESETMSIGRLPCFAGHMTVLRGKIIRVSTWYERSL